MALIKKVLASDISRRDFLPGSAACPHNWVPSRIMRKFVYKSGRIKSA